MKVEMKERKKVEESFPCLMYSELADVIILANKTTMSAVCGCVVFSGGRDDTFGVGYISMDWVINDFRRYEGELILSNN